MGDVIKDQPRPGGAAPFEAASDSIPPGLEYLAHADYLRIKQKIEKCECCTGCESKNKYKIFTPQGQAIYDAKESSNCCLRCMCEANRPFEIAITDKAGHNHVLTFERGCSCQPTCCMCCCLQKLHVKSGAGETYGWVKQECTFCRPRYQVQDATENTVVEIRGPLGCCTCTCCGPCGCRTVGFDIYQNDNQVGLIRKEFSGVGKELLTDADNFYVTFPRELDYKIKASLLGAVFLIDFMYFESRSGGMDGGGD